MRGRHLLNVRSVLLVVGILSVVALLSIYWTLSRTEDNRLLPSVPAVPVDQTSIFSDLTLSRYREVAVEALHNNYHGFYGTVFAQAEARLLLVFESVVQICRLLKVSDVVMIDVGAGHCREHCDIIPMLDAFPCTTGARHFTYEPLPLQHADLLRVLNDKHRDEHDCVASFNVAVGSSEGQATFVINGSQNSTTSGLKEIGVDNGREYLDGSEEITVDVVTLDQQMKGAGVEHVHFIKVDVEGAEWLVLQGARNLLESGRIDVLVVEYQHFWNSDSFNFVWKGTVAPSVDAMKAPTLKTVSQWLHERGYDTFLMHERGVLQVNGDLWHDDFELCRVVPEDVMNKPVLCWCDILVTRRHSVLVEGLLAMLQSSFLPVAPRSLIH